MLDFNKTYEVVNYSVGDTKSGSKMGKLQVREADGDAVMNCILWEETLNRYDDKIFRTGNLLKILSGSYNAQYNNCLVSGVELVKEAKLGLDKLDRDLYFEKIISYVQKVKDEKLNKYLTSLLFEHEQEFKIAPAAKLMHHNYLGGLLVHTLECLRYAEILCDEFYKAVNTDEVFAACILHDYGKIFEYNINVESGLIEYNEDFRKEWISHSQWGFSNCMMHGFTKIAKMIATHHARLDWGAIVDLDDRNLEPIDYLIHHIDDLSAKFGKIAIRDLELA